ncbi:MAG: GTPase [Myxococcota bacterium]|nr:GTPase [Myxococcota bacterium]
MPRARIVILGAAGRDFHDFNLLYRDDPEVEVVAFTATQIPGIADRRYPPSLSGPNHPDGIPILPESELEALIRRQAVDRVVFAYSDVPHAWVMHLASRTLSSGADFEIPGPGRTMLRSGLPVIAVSAVRTGCGKSQTARWIVRRLRDRGVRVAALRHPMPYGDLERQRVQRFAKHEDLAAASCTTEEREEYEPYLEAGGVVFAGVDYAAILAAAETEADVIVWDGGNNDFPFVRPDLHVVLVDALRPDQVASHHPGEVVARMADVVVVNKVRSAEPEQVERAVSAVRELRPDVPILRAASPVRLDDPEAVRGRRVVVVDDGPTLTHGGMAFGAGHQAAVAAGAQVVDPRPGAAPEILAVYRAYPHLERVLPAMGYGEAQLDALRRTLDAADADCIVAGTPVDLAALVPLRLPVVRARYEYEDAEEPGLGAWVDRLLEDQR